MQTYFIVYINRRDLLNRKLEIHGGRVKGKINIESEELIYYNNI